MSGANSDGLGGIAAEHFAALSHELRTPLNGVIGMARLLEGTPLTAEQRDYVAALTQSGEHLLNLVNDVLDYARLGTGRVELTPSVIDIEDLLRSVCELLSPRAHEKGLEIGWAAGLGLAPILADQGRLRQILLNFVGNAVKFVDRGGVLLTADPLDGGRVRFTVADTGPGVPEAERERIFEAFSQMDPAAGGSLGGAGLGLAIARRIAGAMGGAAGVEVGEFGGAAFWFEAVFPVAGPAQKSAPLKGFTVVVASPSAVVRAAAERQVEASGGRPRSASGVAEALSVCGPEAVLLVDRALSRPGAPPRAPPGRAAVILLRPEERSRIRGYRQAGFAGYLIKPLRPSSLVARVLAATGAAPGPDVLNDERIKSARTPAETADAAPGARVLLVEDNAVNALLASTLLRREGCRVDHAGDGAAALAALAESRYDLVLMDVRMPVMDGLAATAALRGRGLTVPVVALTANDFDDDRRACDAAGMNDILAKPLAADALREVLARWAAPAKWPRLSA